MEFKKHNHCVWILLGSWFKVFLGFPRGSASKESTCNVGDLGSIPWVGRSAGEGKGYPLKYSVLENSMDCIVHGVAKSWTQLSNCHNTILNAALMHNRGLFSHKYPSFLLGHRQGAYFQQYLQTDWDFVMINLKTYFFISKNNSSKMCILENSPFVPWLGCCTSTARSMG